MLPLSDKPQLWPPSRVGKPALLAAQPLLSTAVHGGQFPLWLPFHADRLSALTCEASALASALADRSR